MKPMKIESWQLMLTLRSCARNLKAAPGESKYIDNSQYSNPRNSSTGYVGFQDQYDFPIRFKYLNWQCFAPKGLLYTCLAHA